MNRRTLLKLGAGSGIALGLAGLAVAQWESPLNQGRLSASGREIFLAVGGAILDGSLPAAPAARTAALDGLLLRVEGLIAGLPGATQDELAELLCVLSSRLGRLALCGLWTGWAETPSERLQQQLQSMRTSSLGLRQQVYHAFHDLVNGAYFSDPATWAQVGYAGPVTL